MVRALDERKRTPAEWLAWEERQPERWELIGDEPVMMAGGTARHHDITANIFAALRQRLRGGPCRPYMAEMKALFPHGQWTYPDVLARCGARLDRETGASNPVVIVEVLSPGTENYDLQAKRWFYVGMPHLQHVMFVAQDETFVELYSRAEEGTWRSVFFKSAEPAVPLAAIEVELPMAVIYEDVAFSPTEMDEAELPSMTT